jgi:hypothetical protein
LVPFSFTALIVVVAILVFIFSRDGSIPGDWIQKLMNPRPPNHRYFHCYQSFVGNNGTSNTVSKIHELPDYSEKYLLILQSSLQDIKKCNSNPNVFSKSKRDIQEYLKKLQEYIVHENFYGINNAKLPAEIENLSNRLNTVENCEQMIEFGSLFKEIYKRSINVNIPMTIELIQESKNVAVKLVDQQAIFLLAPSGSGKTTSIHKICGTEFYYHRTDRVIKPNPSTIDSSLQHFIIGDTSISETRSVRAIKFILHHQEYYLVDTPGFGDTGGPEQDLANGVGLIYGAHQTNTLLPLIVISAESGNNQDELSKLFDTLASIFPFYDYENQFVFIITRLKIDASYFMNTQLSGLENKMFTLNAKKIFTEFRRQFIDGFVPVIDLLNHQAIQFLSERISNITFLNNPKSLQYFITYDTRQKLVLQLQQEIDKVKYFLTIKQQQPSQPPTQQYEIVNYLLRRMVELEKVLLKAGGHNILVQNALVKSQEEIETYMNNIANAIKPILESEIKDDLKYFSSSTIDAFVEVISIAYNIHTQIDLQFISPKAMTYSKLMTFLQQIFKELKNQYIHQVDKHQFLNANISLTKLLLLSSIPSKFPFTVSLTFINDVNLLQRNLTSLISSIAAKDGKFIYSFFFFLLYI